MRRLTGLSVAALKYWHNRKQAECKENRSEYSLECEIRCFEDRFPDESVADFIQGIKKGIKESGKNASKYNNELLINITIAAGRKDLVLRFFNQHVRGLPHATLWKFETFREGLQKLLQPKNEDGTRRYDFVDRIAVNINKQPPGNEEE